MMNTRNKRITIVEWECDDDCPLTSDNMVSYLKMFLESETGANFIKAYSYYGHYVDFGYDNGSLCISGPFMDYSERKNNVSIRVVPPR